MTLLAELLAKNTPPASKSFSDHCLDAMNYYYANMARQFGSRYLGTVGATDEKTDCSTFVWNVLMYGFTQIGRNDIATELRNTPDRDALSAGHDIGSDRKARRWSVGLAAILKKYKWDAHYWNPDIYNPRDRKVDTWWTRVQAFFGINPPSSEHKWSFQIADDTGIYYKVPLSGFIVGYNKTTRNYLQENIDKYKDEFKDNMDCLNRLKKVKFCVGTTKGGLHTFILSNGYIWEAHWDVHGGRGGSSSTPAVRKGSKLQKGSRKYPFAVGGTEVNYRDVKKEIFNDDTAWYWNPYEPKSIQLYEKTLFEDWEWLSGVLLTPPASILIPPEEEFVSRSRIQIRAETHPNP